MLPASSRRTFALIESTFTEEQARVEALRCVQCAAFCDKCVEVCPNRANYTFRVEPVSWRLPVLGAQPCARSRQAFPCRTEEFRIAQDRQILHVDDFCNECDNCQTFCVHQGRPYIDKPRLFLDRGLFEAEHSNAFHLDGPIIRRREKGEECRLTVNDEGMVFEAGAVRVSLSADWEIRAVTTLQQPPAGLPGFSLRPAAEMLVLYRGIERSLPFLLLR